MYYEVFTLKLYILNMINNGTFNLLLTFQFVTT